MLAARVPAPTAQEPAGASHSRLILDVATPGGVESQLATFVPSVVLFDVGAASDARTFAMVSALSARAKTIVVAETDDESFAIRALKAGASGFCPRNTAPALIRKAVQLVEAGESWSGRRIMLRLIEELASASASLRDDIVNSTRLTNRERAVARLRRANVRVLFDFFFPGVIPGDVLHVPPMKFTVESPIVHAIVSAIIAEPQKAVALAAVDQIELPYRTLSELVFSIVRPLGYNIRGTNHILARTGGQSPFGNLTTWYTGLGLYDATVNAGVGRFASKDAAIRYLNDYYRPKGTLTAPLLTLHTTMDPDVPFFHEAALAKIVTTARTSKWLTQQSVQRYGHCNVTPAEVLLTLGRLVNWAETGVKPSSGDVTLQLAIESPESATGTTQNAVTTELGFLEAIISSTAGISLP